MADISKIALPDGKNYDIKDQTVREALKNFRNDLDILAAKVDNYHDTVVYGWSVNPNESDPSDAVTYLADAMNMIPAKMGADSFDYGSWKNAFFMPKPCMLRYDGTVAYYLDPNDYDKKIDGTPSDVSNPLFEGNAMMEWPLIWYKFVGGVDNGRGFFYVSDRQVDESYHCWCNYDSKNNITPHFYTAIYNSTRHNDKFRSLSERTLTRENGSGYTTGQAEIDYCVANNCTSDVEWYTDVYSDRILINALLVLIGKSLNTQEVFGRGLVTGEEDVKNVYVTGTLNDKGLFYGVTTNGNSGVKTFGMENWWGCVYHRTAGCMNVSYDYKVKLTYGTADGSTTEGYNSTGVGYISIGEAPDKSGFIRTCKYDKHGYFPFDIAGSSTTYYADYYNHDTSTRYLLAGGRVGIETNAGAFNTSLSSAFTGNAWSVSTALSCKPLANKEA